MFAAAWGEAELFFNFKYLSFLWFFRAGPLTNNETEHLVAPIFWLLLHSYTNKIFLYLQMLFHYIVAGLLQ